MCGRVGRDWLVAERGRPGAWAQTKAERFQFKHPNADIVVVNTFTLVDRNKDGKVTGDEFYDHVKSFSFTRLDTDKDKAVSREEWDAVEDGPGSEAYFSTLDRNADGRITFKEFRSDPDDVTVIANLFRTLDTNGDGVLELSEVSK